MRLGQKFDRKESNEMELGKFKEVVDIETFDDLPDISEMRSL